MSPMKYLLDTDHIVEILKGKPEVTRRLEDAFIKGDDVSISGVAYWETKRGFLVVDGTVGLAAFDEFCRTCEVILLGTRSVFDTAAKVDSDLRKTGKTIKDADVLIASVALENELTLITNDDHFNNTRELKTENWITTASANRGKPQAA